MYSPWLDELIKMALEEDVGPGDLTSVATVAPGALGEGEIIARQYGVIAGLEVARRVYQQVDGKLKIRPLYNDGDFVKPGERVAVVSGPLVSLLTAERTALNFLQRLSGIATATSDFCKTLEGTPVRLLDTRKTTPGLRYLEKHAVRVGGGRNHRLGLFDGVLIKENHISAAGGVKEALRNAKENVPVTVKIEIEVVGRAQLEEALKERTDIIMLDNWELESIKEAVELTRGRAKLEVSGEVTREKLRELASTGVDYVSSGSITHSAGILDLSFLLV